MAKVFVICEAGDLPIGTRLTRPEAIATIVSEAQEQLRDPESGRDPSEADQLQQVIKEGNTGGFRVTLYVGDDRKHAIVSFNVMEFDTEAPLL